MILEEIIERFKNGLSLMIELQAEEMKMRFTEDDLKSIIYYLSELKFIKEIKILNYDGLKQIPKDRLKKLIDGAKLSIIPDIKAKWQRVLDGAWIYAKCSSCGSLQDVTSNYCPNCGAKMEESEDGENI